MGEEITDEPGKEDREYHSVSRSSLVVIRYPLHEQ
jgi:hypothetical protein